MHSWVSVVKPKQNRVSDSLAAGLSSSPFPTLPHEEGGGACAGDQGTQLFGSQPGRSHLEHGTDASDASSSQDCLEERTQLSRCSV